MPLCKEYKEKAMNAISRRSQQELMYLLPWVDVSRLVRVADAVSCDACRNRKEPDRDCSEKHCAITAVNDEIIVRNIPTLYNLKEGWKKGCNFK